MARTQFDMVEPVIGQAELTCRVLVPRAAVLLLVGRVGEVVLGGLVESRWRRAIAVGDGGLLHHRRHAGHVLQVALADQRRSPPGGAKQVDERVGIERERDAVVAHAMERGHAPGRKRCAIGLADRARHVEAVERCPPRGERVDRRRADGPVAVAAQMVRTQLVGDEEQDIGAVGHGPPSGDPYSANPHMSAYTCAVMVAIAPAEDARFMALALALGRRGLGRTWPNPSVGAVIVRDDGGAPVVVGRGWTQAGGRPHAEIEALRRAGAAARGATLYVTLEPCSHHGKSPPCADAIVAAGIARVVSALEDPNPEVAGQGHARLRAAGIAVEVGLGADAARRAHAGHIRRVRDGRPHVMLKLAVSADGKSGLAGRRPAAITNEPARARVHRMRAMNDAILIGIGTALADDPQLTCRLPGMKALSPVRVVLDARLRLRPDSALARSAGATPVWAVAGADAPPEAARSLAATGVELLHAPAQSGRIDLA